MAVDFDSGCKLVTSHVLQPLTLAFVRLLIGVFFLVSLIFMLIWEMDVLHDGATFFSYFTNLTFIGTCSYFFAAGVQTFFFARKHRVGSGEEYPLQEWPRLLQYLHVLLSSTVMTFPILVTIVYWTLLASPSSFATPYASFANIVKHILNSVFALFEILFTDVEPMPWRDLPATILILGGYIGVAYITRSTQGFYTYSFLDPQKGGKRLAAYIVGIAFAQIVIFMVVWGVITTRQKITTEGPKITVEAPNKEENINLLRLENRDVSVV